jgi:hypothetical protein
MSASTRGHTDIVKLFLEAGADKNARDDVRGLPTYAFEYTFHSCQPTPGLEHASYFPLSLVGTKRWVTSAPFQCSTSLYVLFVYMWVCFITVRNTGRPNGVRPRLRKAPHGSGGNSRSMMTKSTVRYIVRYNTFLPCGMRVRAHVRNTTQGRTD